MKKVFDFTDDEVLEAAKWVVGRLSKAIPDTPYFNPVIRQEFHNALYANALRARRRGDDLPRVIDLVTRARYVAWSNPWSRIKPEDPELDYALGELLSDLYLEVHLLKEKLAEKKIYLGEAVS